MVLHCRLQVCTYSAVSTAHMSPCACIAVTVRCCSMATPIAICKIMHADNTIPVDTADCCGLLIPSHVDFVTTVFIDSAHTHTVNNQFLKDSWIYTRYASCRTSSVVARSHETSELNLPPKGPKKKQETNLSQPNKSSRFSRQQVSNQSAS